MQSVAKSEQVDNFCRSAVQATELMLPADEHNKPYRSNETARVLALWVAVLKETDHVGPSGYRLLQAIMGLHAPCAQHEITEAKATAATIELPWTHFCGQYEDHDDEIRALTADFHRQLLNTPPGSFAPPSLDSAVTHLDEDYKVPDWLVPGILGRARTHQLSGSWESGKSLFREWMMACSLLGKPFLGRDVPQLRWQILDGEQTLEDVEVRLKAFGVTDALFREHVHFTGKGHLKLGTDAGNAHFARVADRFKPDIIWVDSLMRCCATGLSNEDAVRLNDDVFSPLAEDHNAAVVASHHHTKSSGNRSTTSDASLGGIQFTGQPDITMTLAQTKGLIETPLPDGTMLTESHLAFRPSKGSRGNFLTLDAREHIVVQGVRRADGATLSLSLDHLKAETTLDDRVLAALDDGPLGNTALAKKLGVSRTGKALEAALGRLIDRRAIVKTDDKLYERTETT
jgi:hypothetical protein